MFKLVKVCLVGAAAVAVTAKIVTQVLSALDNSIAINIFEQIILPAESSESYTELSLAVTGEVRISSRLTSKTTFLMKTNALLGTTPTDGSSFTNRRSSGKGSQKNSASDSMRTLDSFDSNSSSSVQLKNTVVCDICDTYSIERGAPIIFTPAAIGHVIFMRYDARSHERFLTPVSVRDCSVEPASFPGAHRLSFELFVHQEVSDLTFLFLFPKNARILSYVTQGVGRFYVNANNPYGSEMIWSLGTILETDPSSNNASPKKSASSKVAMPDDTIRGNGPDDSIVQLGRRLRVVSFEVTYVITNAEGAIFVPDPNGVSPTRGSPSSQRGKKPNRRERRQMERDGVVIENDDDDERGGGSEYSDATIPAVTVSYASSRTASGFTVKKLEVMQSQENWDYNLTSAAGTVRTGTGATVKMVCDAVAERILWRKLKKELGTVTAFSQTIKVEPRY